MNLIDGIKKILDHNGILFLGSGFSTGGKNFNGQNMKTGAELSRAICRNLGIKESDNLSISSQRYIEDPKCKKSLAEFIEFLSKELVCTEISQDQKIIANLPWKRIYTTNYDNSFELASEECGYIRSSITITNKRYKPGRQLEQAIVHINGSILNLNEESFYDEFKITDENYTKAGLLESSWKKMFDSDFISAECIFFIGYSLQYDQELVRHIANLGIKHKCFFIDRDFDDDDKEMGSQSFFYGNGFISRALDCSDADKTGIIDNVTAFIKKCAEHGKKDIEDSIKELLEGFESMRKDLDSQRDIVKKEKKKDKTKAFIPAVIVLALLAVCVWYFFASGDWLGKVLGVAGVVLVLKFGGKFIGRSFSNAKAEGVEWDNVAEQQFAPIIEDMESQVQAVMRYCIDLDNYNIVLDNLKNKDKFMEGYLEGEFDGMKDYDQVSDNSEKFIFDLLDGKMERYNYLLDAVK